MDRSFNLKADTILVQGKIITVDKNFSIAEAVAVKDGVLIGVGTDSEIQKLAGKKTERIDLGGKTVIPGIIDGHAHMDREGLKCLY
ncbi:MAG: amidohydrolase, partial [Deltaproteobacteria bacterium]|nr:amidohydrolase [Deltaproteobacteria bacterium]